MAITIGLFFVMFLFCHLSNKKLNSNLSPLLYIPDSEADIYQENADKIKSAVEMLRKNFEVDTQNIMIPIVHSRKRKHPKEAAISNERTSTVIVLAVLALTIHLSCLFFFSAQYDAHFVSFKKMRKNSNALLKVYNGAVELTSKVSHLGVVSSSHINTIRENMRYLSYNLNLFEFSPELTTLISTLFF